MTIPAGAFLPWWATAADAIAVGSILDATGPINIYGKPMIDATKFARCLRANGSYPVVDVMRRLYFNEADALR